MRVALSVDRSVDRHTHSDVSDGAATPAAMADAALAAGLRVWGLADHVRADTAWLPDYVVHVRALRRDGLLVECGVEAKLLDSGGNLDLPTSLPAIDYVLVADHQFPCSTGPVQPATIRAGLTSGRLRAPDVVATLVTATCAGVARAPVRPIVAHLFSLLPKLGLSEDDVTDEHRQALARACLVAGAAVEVNQKWACPSRHTLEYLAGAGVELVAGSDAHRTEDVGRHDYLDSLRPIGSGQVVRGRPTGLPTPRDRLTVAAP